MDAPHCELLVHITACSTVSDDRRYISLAQSILDFRPATVTKAYGPESDSSAGIDATAPDNAGVAEAHTIYR